MTPLVLLLALALPALAIAADDAPRPLFVEGYAGRESYAPGETVDLHVSTSAPTFAVEVARLGAERTVVFQAAKLAGAEHPVPEDASSHGCRWPVATTIPIPETWASGYYSVRLSVADSGGAYRQRGRRTAESEGYFIVRPKPAGTGATILLQLSTNTYNAYNNWGGHSLYAYHDRDKVQGRRVSNQRPPASQFPSWEQPFVQWAERQGYTLDYAANSDLEFHPELLDPSRYKLVLSVGHDEYWSAPMRDHLERYIARGGNVAFLSGNTCCWQVRTEDDGRALTCFKQAEEQDPLYRGPDTPVPLLSSLWSHHLVRRPENTLTGVGFLWGGYHLSHGQYLDGKGGYTVHRPDHWLFAGTDLKRDDLLGAKHTIVGYECDGCEFTRDADGLPVPTHRDGTPATFVILASASARWHPDDCEWYERWQKGREGAAVFGTYTAPGGGTVVTAGSTDWAHGLRGGDPAVERITRNLLDRLGR